MRSEQHHEAVSLPAYERGTSVHPQLHLLFPTHCTPSRPLAYPGENPLPAASRVVAVSFVTVAAIVGGFCVGCFHNVPLAVAYFNMPGLPKGGDAVGKECSSREETPSIVAYTGPRHHRCEQWASLAFKC